VKKTVSLFLLVACVISFGGNVTLRAQITGAAVAGSVSNQNGEPIAGARIFALNPSTNQSRTAVTDDKGAYRLPTLMIGAYKIKVEADQYTSVNRELILRVNEDARVDFELTPAGASEQINVVGSSAPITETTSSVLGIVIENKQITELPINGRNFLQLGGLVANVNSTPSLRSGAEGGARNGPFAISGQRDRSLTFLVDGVDNTNSVSDGLSAHVSIDAIQEFKMITSLGSAELGYHSGGMINIVTKSGSNDFHFTLFEFLRNNKLDAPNHFEDLAGRAASHFVNNQFGATVSGPILKDKTFFLGNYEGQRLRAGSPQFSNVPTVAQRNGIFFNPATGQAVQLPVDPVSAAILKKYVPVPNIQSGFGNFLSTPTLTGRNDFAIGRVDHLLTGDDVINARYYVSDSDTFYPINLEGVRFSTSRPPSFPGFGLIERTRTQNLAAAYTHSFGIRTVNDFRFGYNHHFLDQLPQNQDSPSDVGFTGVQSSKGLFIMSAPGVSTFGAIAYPVISRFGNYYFSDSLSFIYGRHALKTGGEIRLLRQFMSTFVPGEGSLAFTGAASHISPLADFILGIPGSVVQFQRPFASPWNQTVAGFFIQDDYQISRRLVLNLGLRYELDTVIDSPTHELTNFTFERGLFTPGVDTKDGLYKGDHNNFAPRLGFAWSMTGDGRTVLRGGYGIFYDTIVHTLSSNLSQNNPSSPYLKLSVAPRGPGKLGGIFNPATLIPLPAPFNAYDVNLRTPYAQHFNLTVQRELGSTMIVSVGYVGSLGTKLVDARNINQAVYIPGVDASGKPLSTADPNNINSRRPSQLLHLTPFVAGAIDYFETGSDSNYHSLQATFNKRMGRGLSLLGTYTWGKSIDNSADPFGFTGDSGTQQDSRDLRQERARSVFDIAHQFTAGCTYDLPFKRNQWVRGWQVNGIATFRTGQPFTALLGADPSLTGSAFVRPNDAPGVFINKDGQVFLNRSLPLDPATRLPAAIVPGVGQFGGLGRNTFTGPGYKNVDLSILKDTRIGERLRVQSRFELFNLFNTTNLALPERRLSEPLFGLSPRTQDVAGGVPGIGGGGPRVIQLALKLVF